MKLSVRKQKWVGQFKPKQVKGLPLSPSAAAEARYYQRLEKLILRMTRDTQKQLDKFFAADHSQEYFAMDASVASQARILMNKLIRQFDTIFGTEAKPIAESVVDDADLHSESSLKLSLKKLSGGLTLKTDFLTTELGDVLTASIAENVGLIKSIASQYLDGVQGAVMRSITTGNGLADLVPFLKQHEGMTLRRARNIANDQTRKAFNSINKVRMPKLGIKEYEWLHTAGSQHPRPLHIRMSGNIYSLDKPPVIDEKTGERGIPGQAINCRCRMVPIVKFDEGSE